ncbi:MAG TPA: DUF3039 domain-containing protein [Acidimicrobiia bacterium]|nr:DUF3039 domain-containing protein [Acidimicrobiia bacterium]
MSDTKTRPKIEPRLDDTDTGDHDRYAHYILGRDPKAKITKAMVEGTPLRALCGKRWVPSRDASRYPVCPDCQKIKDRLLRK